jgi:DNA-binding NarL/FixJ family response regulator
MIPHPDATKDKTKNLLLVDDHPIIQIAVKALIESKLSVYQLHTASTRSDAMQLAEKVRPSMALVDLTLPDGDGLDLIRELQVISPGCDVLVFSMQCELRFGPRALRAGASGYLMKSEKISALFEAIQQVEEGRTYYSPALAEHMIGQMRVSTRSSGIESLTDREFQVFRLIGEGRMTKDIATYLKISPKTVDSHRENMKNKLKCGSATALAMMARDWLKGEMM